MNRVIEILMRRDNMSETEATVLLDQTREEIYASGMSHDIVEDIIASNLGLEPDYIFDIIE